jgi:hypothetical protein
MYDFIEKGVQVQQNRFIAVVNCRILDLHRFLVRNNSNSTKVTQYNFTIANYCINSDVKISNHGLLIELSVIRDFDS